MFFADVNVENKKEKRKEKHPPETKLSNPNRRRTRFRHGMMGAQLRISRIRGEAATISPQILHGRTTREVRGTPREGRSALARQKSRNGKVRDTRNVREKGDSRHNRAQL